MRYYLYLEAMRDIRPNPIYFSGVYGLCQLPNQESPGPWQTLKILGLPGAGTFLVRELTGDMRVLALNRIQFFNLAVYSYRQGVFLC